MTYSRTIRMTVAASLSLLLAGGCQTTGSEGATSFTDSISSTFRAINPWDTTPEIDERVIDRLLAGSLTLEKPASGNAMALAPASSESAPENSSPPKEALKSFAAGQRFDCEAATPPKTAPVLMKRDEGMENAYAYRQGLLDISRVENHLNELLGRIQAVSPQPAVPSYVHIEPGRVTMARAEATGAISITLGAFRKTAEGVSQKGGNLSEPAIVFLLAHEYGHVLMNHFKDGQAQSSFQQVAQLAGQVILWHTAKSSGSDSDLNRGLAYSRGIPLLLEMSMLQNWNRREEMLADLFAIDVLERLCYNPKAAINAIVAIGDAENEFGNLPIFDDRLYTSSLGSYLSGNKDAAESQIKESLIESGFQAGTSFMRELMGETHPSSTDRRKLITAYMEEHYDDFDSEARWKGEVLTRLQNSREYRNWDEIYGHIDSASLTMDVLPSASKERQKIAQQEMYKATNGIGKSHTYTRLQFALLRAEDKDFSKAIANLNLIDKNQKVPFTAHDFRIQWNIFSNNFRDAERALKQAAAEYPSEKNRLLPNTIRLFGAMNREKEVNETYVQCKSLSENTLVSECNAAWNEYRYKNVEKLEDKKSKDMNPGQNKNTS